MKPQWTTCPCKELVLVCISRQVKHSWTLSFMDSSWHGYTKTPHQTLTSIQVNANLKNQDLSTDLRWVAKRNRKSAPKFTQVANGRTFHAYKMTCDQLVPTSLGGPTCLGIWARPKSTQVIAGHNASPHKWVAKRNASRALVQNLHWPVSTCESVWPELKCREKRIKAGFSKIVTVKFCFASLNSRFASFHGRRQYTPTWRCTWICGQD